MTVDNHKRAPRGTVATHLPVHVVERILELLPPPDARLLAQLLNDEYGRSSCYFFDGRWVCDPLFPREL